MAHRLIKIVFIIIDIIFFTAKQEKYELKTVTLYMNALDNVIRKSTKIRLGKNGSFIEYRILQLTCANRFH